MNFEHLREKKIILFGKSRALSDKEFVKQLQNHNIELTEDAEDGVALIIEGRMVNPVEQEKLERLYAEKAAPIVEVEHLERWLCQGLEADTLVMSLKLSGDRERLMGYLQNPYIPNPLFLRLLSLYNWEGEGFFENDDNRDITAALVSRFYENIERNHNVQYANMGIMHLLNQGGNAELTETIAMLEPLQIALKEGCDNSTQKILNAIALHPNTTEKVLKQWLKKGNDDIQMLIAMREDLSLPLQKYLLGLNKNAVKEVLSLNHTLAREVALTLLEEFPENITKEITLDEALFEHLLEQYDEALAHNRSLTLQMQEVLVHRGEHIKKVLASNTALKPSVFELLLKENHPEVVGCLIHNDLMDTKTLRQLYETAPERYSADIAANTKTERAVLEALADSGDIEVLLALAGNASTPVELLYQFQLDSRLARAVKENASFGRHIQRDNIGWDV